MANIFRIAFWTIALSWMEQARTKAIIPSDITYMAPFLCRNVICPKNMSFYTPPPNEGCMKALLECVISELVTAENKCEDKGAKIDQTVEQLILFKNDLPTPSNATACVCDAGPSAPWDDFLEHLDTVVKMYGTMQLTAGDATKA